MTSRQQNPVKIRFKKIIHVSVSTLLLTRLKSKYRTLLTYSNPSKIVKTVKNCQNFPPAYFFMHRPTANTGWGGDNSYAETPPKERGGKQVHSNHPSYRFSTLPWTGWRHLSIAPINLVLGWV